MKRHPSLRKLSDDHHRALVLSRRLRRLSAERETVDLAALSAEVRREFDTDLEPHFRIEERCLLPMLRGKEPGLVERIEDDHARLRDSVRSSWTLDSAVEFGTVLEKHVRFEERVLFPTVEALLSDAELAAVDQAVAKLED